jgi:CBS domain-containing protein
MMPLVNFARLYALRHEVERTGTMDRLDRLHEAGVLSASSHAEFEATYSFLMGLRLRHQARLAVQGLAPDNHVNPKDLNDLEQAMVRKALAQASLALKKISFDFLGAA